VFKSGGYTIFTSLKGWFGFVYCTMSIGGDHCCQYGPSPCVKVMVPFHPVNLLARSVFTMSGPFSLLAMLIASASSMSWALWLKAQYTGASLNSSVYFLRKAAPGVVSFMVAW